MSDDERPVFESADEMFEHLDNLCPDCGKPADSFACKIRHIQVNTGWAKSAND